MPLYPFHLEQTRSVSFFSAGPLVAGRTKDFVQRILAASAGGQNQRRESLQGEEEAAG